MLKKETFALHVTRYMIEKPYIFNSILFIDKMWIEFISFCFDISFNLLLFPLNLLRWLFRTVVVEYVFFLSLWSVECACTKCCMFILSFINNLFLILKVFQANGKRKLDIIPISFMFVLLVTHTQTEQFPKMLCFSQNFFYVTCRLKFEFLKFKLEFRIMVWNGSRARCAHTASECLI